jgi:hypothetical protein
MDAMQNTTLLAVCYCAPLCVLACLAMSSRQTAPNTTFSYCHSMQGDCATVTVHFNSSLSLAEVAWMGGKRDMCWQAST